MSEPFLGEVRMFGFNFPPRGWALCDGQILPINQNQALFSLLGTTYGGDGRTTFALPDLRGRVPVHIDGAAGFSWGQRAGEEAHVLSTAEIPSHDHRLQATAEDGDQPIPAGASIAALNTGYGPLTDAVDLAPATLADAGQGAGHPNMQPYLTISFCIALVGLFPSRN